MSRLCQRLAHVERAIQPAGRLFVIHEDGSEDIEAKIARCEAEAGLSHRDIVVIRDHFGGRVAGKTQEPAWRISPLRA
jgi:hypothetical protein